MSFSKQQINSEEIKKWESSILKMKDDHFFDIMRAYFGNIQTPFNKHDLFEQLSSFLREEDVQRRILDAISSEDIQILTVIYYLKEPSENIIYSYFFGKDKNKIYRKLINLKERLLIYIVANPNTPNPRYFNYSINPILIERLKPILHIPFLMPCEKHTERVFSIPCITPVFFSVLYSYITQNPDMYKKDGKLRKKVLNDFTQLFPAIKDVSLITNIIERIISLRLVLQKNSYELVVVEEQWEKFAKLSFLEKIIYLAVADTYYPYFKDYGIDSAYVLHEMLHLFKSGTWYSKKDMYRAFFLVYAKHVFGNSKILYMDLYSAFDDEYVNTRGFERPTVKILLIASEFGLLVRDGDNFAFNEYFCDLIEDEKPMLISNDFALTLKENASFLKLLPLLPALKPKRLDTFALFEFSHLTCQSLFEVGMTSKTICNMLQEVSEHSLPQNVAGSMEQWNESYGAVSLYNGYVLCVNEKKRKFFKSDSPLFSLVRKEISDGVYLMATNDPKEIARKLEKAGLDFIFFNNKEKFDIPYPDYPSFEAKEHVKEAKEKALLKAQNKEREAEWKKKEDTYLKKLENANLDKDSKDILQARIERRLVLTEQQISSATINKKVRRAGALDFLGKIRLLEDVMKDKTFVEIVMMDKKTITGTVDELWKSYPDIQMVRIITEDADGRHSYNLHVSKIFTVKTVINSIFS